MLDAPDDRDAQIAALTRKLAEHEGASRRAINILVGEKAAMKSTLRTQDETIARLRELVAGSQAAS